MQFTDAAINGAIHERFRGISYQRVQSPLLHITAINIAACACMWYFQNDAHQFRYTSISTQVDQTSHCSPPSTIAYLLLRGKRLSCSLFLPCSSVMLLGVDTCQLLPNFLNLLGSVVLGAHSSGTPKKMGFQKHLPVLKRH